MTLAHAAVLYFEGKKEMSKKRIQKLKVAGIIRERPRSFSSPSILYIGSKGIEILRAYGHLVEYPEASLPDLENRARVSDLTLRHELEVMDVKAAMAAGIRMLANLRLPEFSTWPALHEFEARRPSGERVDVKPDGFLRIHESEDDSGVSEYAYFLEVDRSTETLEALFRRIQCYLDYYRSGGFAVRNGQRPDAYKEFPFRVLIVFKTAERRNNMAERLIGALPPVLTQVWLSTLPEVLADPLGLIWIRPADYRDAFEAAGRILPTNHDSSKYRRNVGRDGMVESIVKKHHMLS